MPTLDERVTELERQVAELNRYVAGNDPRPRSERPLEPTLIEQIGDLLDAKLDERFSEYDGRIKEQFAEQERRLDERFNAQSNTIEELLHMQKAEIISELKSES